jgi:(4-(4-[2-(gamma-L-glutamylamino)ethyl]phenoxymethyl)furan-2-yl)methanamine synthase
MKYNRLGTERDMRVVIGWDVGGAHLKAARAEDGCIVEAVQVASPLRLGLERLAQAFIDAKVRIGSGDLHVVTMTGELADTFASRAEGVQALAALAARELAPATVSLYAGRAGFIAPEQAQGHWKDIASANWYASASLAARAVRTALLVDIGSTTTDLVPIVTGSVAARGYTDAERLAAGELVYTGMVRSFAMAMAERAPFAGRWSPLINENFATMADVHRILGQLPDGVDQMATPDGRAKSIEASRARLARMIGCDMDDASETAWSMLAQWFAEGQIRAIIEGAMLVLSYERVPASAPIVGAGIGIAVVREVARRLGRKHVAFDTIINVAPHARDWASYCAPAAALACLASP